MSSESQTASQPVQKCLPKVGRLLGSLAGHFTQLANRNHQQNTEKKNVLATGFITQLLQELPGLIESDQANNSQVERKGEI